MRLIGRSKSGQMSKSKGFLGPEGPEGWVSLLDGRVLDVKANEVIADFHDAVFGSLLPGLRDCDDGLNPGFQVCALIGAVHAGVLIALGLYDIYHFHFSLCGVRSGIEPVWTMMEGERPRRACLFSRRTPLR